MAVSSKWESLVDGVEQVREREQQPPQRGEHDHGDVRFGGVVGEVTQRNERLQYRGRRGSSGFAEIVDDTVPGAVRTSLAPYSFACCSTRGSKSEGKSCL